MTGWANRDGQTKRAALAATLMFALVPATLFAQDGQFDLRTRASPTPEPTVVGPVDPENPVPRARPRPEPSAAPPPLVLPSASPTADSAASAGAPASARNETQRAARPPGSALDARPTGAPQPTGSGPDFSREPRQATPPPGRRPAGSYRPRNLDLMEESDGIGWWLALAALALLLGAGAWLIWSRYVRTRVSSVKTPEIVRPRIAERQPEPAAEPATPPRTAPAAPYSVP